nr:uncharacterized mitochondrial protein AtMg00810-like [Tanacetum cinerariifolium]
MEQPNSTFVKIPILDTGKFEQWKFRIQQYLQNEHYALWEVIEFGDSNQAPQEVADTGSSSEGSAKKKGRIVAVTNEDMQKRRNDVKARTTLLLALPDEHQLRFSKYKTAQELWVAILKTFGGNEATKKNKKNWLKQQYGNFKAEGKETLEQTFNRLQAIRNRSNLDTMSLDDLYNHLKVYEPEVQKKSELNSHNMAFISSAKSSNGKEEVNTASFSTANTQVSPASVDFATASFSHDTILEKDWEKDYHTRKCRAPRSQDRGRRENFKQGSKTKEQTPKALMAINRVGWDWSYMANEEENHALVADEEALTEFALMAKSNSKNEVFDNSLCSKACKKNTDSLNTKITELSEKLSDTKTTLYHYKLGLSQVEARLVEFKNQEIKFCKKIRGLEFKVESKDNRIERLTKELEELKKEKEGLDSKLTCFQSDSKDLDTPLGSQSNSSVSKKGDSSKRIMSKPLMKFIKATDSPTEVKISKVETVRKPSVKYAKMYINTTKSPKGNSQNVIDDNGYWDSGFSRHMIGNISYLSKYELYDGGYVSFVQGGGKITGKGVIKTGKLEFENVYFVKDLKFNLFSVSQICDNNNSVLFTHSECIVLGRDFKLKDDTDVLLRTPRQHYMYSIDLNNIVSHKDLTCLVAKASTNECMLWHRRLGHLNFKTMNKLVRHNLVRGLPSKCFENDHTCVACLKGKLHKASCKTKFTWTFFLKTKDETSCILWNFITEIENLKDLKAKAVNTACYVQNWVLVNKSQNKTPYELFNGRTHAIGFLKPFGCHVMILNTLDNLGKFDAKRDEGYFIGYSMSSKVFMVFNKRTKRAEENLHVDFLENKLIKKKASPNWLFDIDTLTNFMNYVPVVVAGTASTNFSGTKDAASQDVKKDVSFLRYIALPNWFHEAHLESSTSNAQDACNADAPEIESPIPTVSSHVPTACLNDSPEPSSDTSLISKRVTSQDDTPSLDNILTLSNRFEYILRVTTNTADTNGVEADLDNMKNNISASPTPTFRIHKDHPKSQIIGPVDTPVQTRTKSKEMEEQSFIASIHHKTNPDLLQFCLFFCFLSQEEPKKISNTLKDPSWAEAMQEELLQFKIQNVWSLVDFPKGDLEFPARVYKVEKAMYGLHQAPRAWYGTLSKYLLTNGFQRDTIDQTLFIRKHRGDFILVQVYVDDIIFGSSNPQLCREFKALMHEKFQMSVMGELNFFLGLQVLQKKDGIFLSQDKYVGDILKKFGYSDVRLANTPMDKEIPWGKDRTSKDVDLHLYRSMIGSFMYLTASRPDIMFAVWIWYPKDSPFDLVAYLDSDYGGATQDRKSTTGGCQFLGRRLISWQCKKQTIVATSTTEAKCVAAASGCGQVLWIQNQLLDYG